MPDPQISQMSSDRSESEAALRHAVDSGSGFYSAAETETASRWALAEIDRLREALEKLPDRVKALGGFQRAERGEFWVSRDDVLRLVDEALNGGEDR